MYVINAANVGAALPMGIELLINHGELRDSRNGKVLVADGPVTTVYKSPRERVLFWEDRDANPFFHLFESLWMLAGRNDVAYPAQFVKRMETFSDDGVVFHGAYGYRWRNHFNKDQLPIIAEALKNDPNDRRNVLQLWDANADLGTASKDLPCNTQAYFTINAKNELDMTVCNRSNDVIWGAYGANAVHFSMLQEYMAARIGVSVGRYWQISNNFHGYLDTFDPLRHLANYASDPFKTLRTDIYEENNLVPFPLITVPIEQWERELNMFLDEPDAVGFIDPFFRRVALPMLQAHNIFRQRGNENRFQEAISHLRINCAADDWGIAAAQWLERREQRAIKRAERAKDDGVNYEN